MSAMTEPRIETTASMTIRGRLTAASMLRFAQSVPPDARVSINVDRGGGQLDPGSTTITATWSGAHKNGGDAAAVQHTMARK